MRKLLLIALCFVWVLKAFTTELNFGYLGYINPITNKYDSIRYISHVDGKKINTQSSLEVYEKIILEILDGKIIDNDTVSVYLNDECLLKNYHVTEEKYVLDVPIKSDKIYVLLIVYNNQGNIKPNSTSLKILDENLNELEILRSNYKDNSSVVLRPFRFVTNVAGRDVIFMDKFVSRTKKISIYVRDWGTIDGDSIRLFFNDVCVLDNFMLKRKKHRIELELNTKKPNQLTVYSLNEGSISPNTMQLIIECDNVSYSNSFSLMSNQEVCSSLLIFYKNNQNFKEDEEIKFSRPPPVNKRITRYIRQKVS